MSHKKQKTRLAIFFFYDKDGIVDDYISYLLENLKYNIDDLVVVCNGLLTSESRKKFQKITDKIIVRENKGFDVWAYKEGIEYVGWNEIEKYDELIMMNFTIFGPLYPFKEMFDKMDEKEEIDFWGITVHHGFNFDPWNLIDEGRIPKHIQSNFIVIRNSMLKSYEFKKYWKEMKPINNYGEAVCYHEAIFTRDFERKGFKWEVYIDTKDLEGFTHYPLMLTPLELVKNRRCPVIKRKCFFGSEYDEFLNATTGEPALELTEYIQSNLDYDMNLIWSNLLRTCNMYDIKNRMQLNYILPLDISKTDIKKKKVALIMHLYFEDLIEHSYEYASNIPDYIDVYITTDTEKKKEKILEVFKDLKCFSLKVTVIENRGRDISSLLVGSKEFVKNYEYICFVHDKKTTQVEPQTVGNSFEYKCLENTIGSRDYINNVVNLFEDNPRLGLLTPPPPIHANYYGLISREWGSNYENTIDLSEKLKLKVDIDKNKPPIAPLGTMFWFRTKALEKLFDYNWKYEDFPEEPNKFDGTNLHAIERIYPFVAQDAGFYSSWVMSTKFAKIELTNLNYMLLELNKVIFADQRYQYFQHHYALVDALKNGVGLRLTIRARIVRFLKHKLSIKNFNRLKKIYRKISREE